jgi:predicted RNA-binding Zn-ribbon protein involved in translation (DUF1610 family)
MADYPTRTCPRCKREYNRYPALSRRDNRTNICPDCGNAEAMEDAKMAPAYRGPIYWQENKA